MKRLRKTILIKATSSVGNAMASNAEYHTLIYFCKWLINDYKIIICGIENNSKLTKELTKLGVEIRVPIIKYLFLKNLKFILHIPVSLINTFFDTYKTKPDLLICLGGVFYNGLGIIISGKILNVTTLVRSAEDHIGLTKFEKPYKFNYYYLKLRAFLSRFVIKNSNYFLTVGEWSINYFRKTYKLSEEKSFVIPGPIDKSILNKKGSIIDKSLLKNNIFKKYKFDKNKKVIFFVGSYNYKGVNSLFLIAQKIKSLNLPIHILWVSSSRKIRKKIDYLKLEKIIKIIDPLSRNKLIEIMKGVDFLFWSTSVGVGYGQIMLEATLCGTEVICYLPLGDTKYFIKDQSYISIDEILERLKGNIPSKKIVIPEFMNEKILKIQHIGLLKKILEN